MSSSPDGRGPTLAERLLQLPHARPGPPDRQDRLRPGAELGVMDCSEWFGPTSGGVRTYLLQKAAYVEERPSLRQVMVVPGARSLVGSGEGARCYQLRSPAIPGRAPYRALLGVRAVTRIIMEERPSIIEAGSPLAVPWLLRSGARQLGVPMVCYHHGLLPHNLAADPAGAGLAARTGARLAWRYLGLIDRMFDLTLVGSDFAATALQAEGMERTVRVPLGVDLGCFRPGLRSDARRVREAHGLPADGPLVGFVGRLAPEKELDVAIRGWGEVARRRGATLVLVGDGPLRHRLAALAAGLPVRFVPFVHERAALARLVASFDICLSPGSMETFGLAALEAMASGVPVLSADAGGVSEQVMRSGAGGCFEAGNAGALAEGVIDLLDRDLAALGMAGRHYAEREHSWDTVFDRIFGIYRQLLGDTERA